MTLQLNNTFEEIVARIQKNQLWQFHGGVHPDDKKALSNQSPIAKPPLPAVLHIPLRQHIGNEGSVIVEVGQRVLKGQPLTQSHLPFAVPVHASTSGEVISIDNRVSAHPSGLSEITLTLKPDGLDEWCELHPLTDYTKSDRIKLIEILCDAGISGMGGAGFPTHIKANTLKETEFLVINGIECEPYITADDRLMREHAWQIRQGIDILQHVVKPKYIVIAIEDNKPSALESMKIACKNKPDCSVVSTPTVYPAGGEKQLIQVVTGREVPGDGLPQDIGVMMFNVGTCYAIADAIFHGKPLIERVVTLTGEACENAQNVWALLGTPVAHLADFAKLKTSKRTPAHIIMGGPMMGFSVADYNVPVVKTTNCLLMPEHNAMMQGQNERPCIRCSACYDACPASLLPQQLYWHSKAKEYDKAQNLNLFDCIECGACAYVCPSDIPLVQYYRQAKSAIKIELDEKTKADKAKQRFEARKQRLERDKQEREAKHREAAAARQAAREKQEATRDSGSNAQTKNTERKPKSAAVAAALARAKAKAKAKQAESRADKASKVDTKGNESTEIKESLKKQTGTVPTESKGNNENT